MVAVSPSRTARTIQATPRRRPRRTLPALGLALVVGLLGAGPAGGETHGAAMKLGGKFDFVRMVTTIGVDTYARTIDYSYYGDDTDIPVDRRAAFETFFAELEAAGLAVTEVSQGGGDASDWRVSFEAASPEELTALTNLALSSESTQFEVTWGSGEPGALALEVVDFAECDAICEPDVWLSDEVVVPDDYAAEGAYLNEDGNAHIAMSRNPGVIQYRATQVFDSVSFELSVGVGGELTWTAEFFADAATEELAGLTLSDAVAWRGSWHPLDATTTDGGTLYTVIIEGDDPEEFLDHFAEWSDVGFWSTLSARELYVLDPPSPSHERYRLDGFLVLPVSLVKHLPAGDHDMSITVPPGYTFASHLDGPAVGNGASTWQDYVGIAVDVEVSGAPEGASGSGSGSGGGSAGWVLLLIAVTLVLMFRKRIGAALGGRSESRTRLSSNDIIDRCARENIARRADQIAGYRPDGTAVRRYTVPSPAPVVGESWTPAPALDDALRGAGVPSVGGVLGGGAGVPGVDDLLNRGSAPSGGGVPSAGGVPGGAGVPSADGVPAPPQPGDAGRAPDVETPSVLDRLAGIRTAELPPPPTPWGPTPDQPESTAADVDSAGTERDASADAGDVS